MKKLILSLILACSSAVMAETNVVTHTVTEAAERRARAEAWRETWSKMTPAERYAHREEQKKKLAEARRVNREVRRMQSPDGTITIIYADGSVTVHKYPAPTAK